MEGWAFSPHKTSISVPTRLGGCFRHTHCTWTRAARRRGALCLLSLAVLICITAMYFGIFATLFVGPPKPFAFPGGKRMAYVSSWDDAGNIPSMHLIARLQKEHDIHFPLTINVQTSALKNATVAEYHRLLCRQAGDRLESHTVSHIEGDNDPINDPKEYILSQRIIQNTFGCEHGTTLTYPRGSVPKSVGTRNLIAHLYTAARSTEEGLFDANSDLFALPCLAVEDITLTDIKRAADTGAVLISYGHGVEGQGWRPVPQAQLLQHMQNLKEMRQDIWFTTLPEVVEYLRRSGQLPPQNQALWQCHTKQLQMPVRPHCVA